MNIMSKIKTSKFMNKGLPKKIKDKIYFKYISPKAEAKTDKYQKELMDLLMEILDNKHWALASGAFLLYFRDNVMKGQDFDIYVLDTDFEQIKEKFFEKGFLLKQIFFNKDNQITEYKYMYKEAEMDVFIVRKEKEKYYYTFTLEGTKNGEIIKKSNKNEIIVTGPGYSSFKKAFPGFEKLKKYTHKNFSFMGCYDGKACLEGMYGKEWTMDKKSYDTRTIIPENRHKEIPNAKAIVFEKPIKNYKY